MSPTFKTIKKWFNKYRYNDEDEFEKFYLVEPKYSNRPDLHGLIVLDKLRQADVPIDHQTDCITCEAYVNSMGIPFLVANVRLKHLVGKITEAQVLELVRCGFQLAEHNDNLLVTVIGSITFLDEAGKPVFDEAGVIG